MADPKNKVFDSNQKYVLPEYRKTGFNCPHCHVYSNQRGCFISEYDSDTLVQTMYSYIRMSYYRQLLLDPVILSITRQLKKLYHNLFIDNIELSFCDHCGNYSIWVNQKMVYPNLSIAPLPISEMPETVKELYNEASKITNESPRGACALLRLAIQTLIEELGENENNLNQAIGNLVKKGLPQRIQKALDTVRVIGNNAIHPGVINIKDSPDIANSLFLLLNIICEKMIKEPQTIDNLFDDLPIEQKKAINKRDQQKDVNV